MCIHTCVAPGKTCICPQALGTAGSSLIRANSSSTWLNCASGSFLAESVLKACCPLRVVRRDTAVHAFSHNYLNINKRWWQDFAWRLPFDSHVVLRTLTPKTAKRNIPCVMNEHICMSMSLYVMYKRNPWLVHHKHAFLRHVFIRTVQSRCSQRETYSKQDVGVLFATVRWPHTLHSHFGTRVNQPLRNMHNLLRSLLPLWHLWPRNEKDDMCNKVRAWIQHDTPLMCLYYQKRGKRSCAGTLGCGYTVALRVIAPMSISGVKTFDQAVDNLPHSDSRESGGSTKENLHLHVIESVHLLAAERMPQGCRQWWWHDTFSYG